MAKNSPTKVIGGTLTFADALASVLAGESITKLEWRDPDIYGRLLDGKLVLYMHDKQFHPWILSDGDLLGTDWIVIE